LHRTLQRVAYAQVLADGLTVDRLVLEVEARASQDWLKSKGDPRLCRGGSSSLTFTAVNARGSPLTTSPILAVALIDFHTGLGCSTAGRRSDQVVKPASSVDSWCVLKGCGNAVPLRGPNPKAPSFAGGYLQNINDIAEIKKNEGNGNVQSMSVSAFEPA
jgi:hypothetical protein